MDDRQLTIDERFMQITTTESNDDFFKSINTSPLGEAEHDGNDWVFVHVIRYGGSKGGPNRWRLI